MKTICARYKNIAFPPEIEPGDFSLENQRGTQQPADTTMTPARSFTHPTPTGPLRVLCLPTRGCLSHHSPFSLARHNLYKAPLLFERT